MTDAKPAENTISMWHNEWRTTFRTDDQDYRDVVLQIVLKCSHSCIVLIRKQLPRAIHDAGMPATVRYDSIVSDKVMKTPEAIQEISKS